MINKKCWLTMNLFLLGVCLPNDPDMIHQIGMEEFVSISQENSTVVVPPKVATQGLPQNQMLKGK